MDPREETDVVPVETTVVLRRSTSSSDIELSEAQRSLLHDALRGPNPALAEQILQEGRNLIDERVLAFFRALAVEAMEQRDFTTALAVAQTGSVAAAIAGDEICQVRLAHYAGTAAGLLRNRSEARKYLATAFEKAATLVGSHSKEAATLMAHAAMSSSAFAEGLEEKRVCKVLLTDALQAAERVRAFDLRAALCGELITACLVLGDVIAAARYAELGALFYESGAPNATPFGPDIFSNRLTALASRVIEANREQGADWARRACDLDPANINARGMLALALMDQGELDAARSEWETVLQADHTAYRARLYLAYTLRDLGQLDEALQQLDELTDDQQDADTLVARGEILQEAGRHEQAVEYFSRAVELITATKSSVAPANGAVSSSVALVRLRIIESLRQLNELEAALGMARLLILDPDDESRFLGHLAAGQLLGDLRRDDEALGSFAVAIDIDSHDPRPRIARADALLSWARVEEALPDLIVAATLGAPESAVSRVQAVLERDPSCSSARAVLGRVLTQLGESERATAELTTAIEQSNEDSRLHFWRGLARMSLDLAYGLDEGWNGDVFLRVPGALADLERAVTLDPGNDEAREAFRWLIQRAPGLHSRLSDPQFNALVAGALPGAVAGLRLTAEGMALTVSGKWWDAVPLLEKAQAELAREHLPVIVKALDLSLADVYSQLHDVQAALDHLAAAEDLITAVISPLSPELVAFVQESNDQAVARWRRQRGHFQLEFFGVYWFALLEWALMLRIVKAEVVSRSGDPTGGAAVLENVGDLCRDVEGTFPPAVAVQSLMKISKVLRDAGQNGESLRAVDAALRLADSSDERGSLLITKGTILAQEKRYDLALAAFSEAAAGGEGVRSAEISFTARLNRASIMVHSGRAQHALDLLGDRMPPELQREHDRRGFLQIRAQALELTGRTEDALADLMLTLDSLEAEREGLRLPETRMTWQGNQQHVYSEVVRLSVETGHPRLALEVAEQARSRALLDQLALRTLDSREDESLLLEGERRLAERVDLLRTLDADLRSRGPEAIDLGVVDRLAELDENVDFVEAAGGRPPRISEQEFRAVLSSAEQSLEIVRADVANLRFSGARVAGRPLRYDEIVRGLQGREGRTRLPPAEATEVAASEDAAVLAEFFVGDEEILVFVVAADSDDPEVVRIPAGRDQLRGFVGECFRPGEDPGVDRPEWDDFSHLLVEPLVELSREGQVLWIVPHDSLHNLPLHAGALGSGRLIDRNPVCYSPSASLMKSGQSRRRGPWGRALVVGDSRSDLWHARQEAIDVARRFGTQPLLRKHATKDAVCELLASEGNEIDMIHFACHAYYDPAAPNLSAVVLAPRPGREDDLVNLSRWNLTMEDILQLNIGADLVTLSACESGLSIRRLGDEMIGLPRALLAADVASVVVSLWSVDELSTRLLMNRFYSELWGEVEGALRGVGPRVGKAQALRNAQRAVRDVTAGQVVQTCTADLAEAIEARERASLLVDRARVHGLAGGLGDARRDLHEAALLVPGAPAAFRSKLTQVIEASLESLHEKAEAPAIDYERRPFDHLYHWAPFLLYGDWM